ncbi:MAG: hypothetical protein MUF71_10285 [Candidatus Kapabacteria bacterium]|jgi:hypothetical protein|nr:hypothetical protein [Candidatus Kapabacteria bacterium]
MAKASEKYKPFRAWNADDVEETFALRQVPTLKPLQELLLHTDTSLSESEKERLRTLSQRLAANVENWNEEELKLKFIAHLLELVDYDTEGCKIFADRTISAEVKGKILSDTVDVLIARGNRIPKAPLLCIHEYKKERGSSNDPLGQVLATMIAAQAFNASTKPVYGAYTVGRLWFLLALQGSEYAVSKEFNAADEENAFALFQTLKHFKNMIPSLL